ncbi:MAG: hypothetical protein IJE78_14665 [Bacteroidaceae bacterium]|nr:hypothetical protein [Bacteroidaceae bacterium]
MIKKLSTLLLLTVMSAPLLAQTISGGKRGDGVMFAPQKGQWQVSVFLGGNNNFYDTEGTTDFVLPGLGSSSIGLGSNGQNGNLNKYLQIDGINNNNLTNIVGIEGKYFLSNCWDINMQFSMNVNLTPSKDFVEGDFTVSDMKIPEQQYISARMTNNWFVSVGSNRYFKVSNPRIHPYLGAAVGFQMARIETNEPYTGDTWNDGINGDDIVDDDFNNYPSVTPPTGAGNPDGAVNDEGVDEDGLPIQVYRTGSRAGQAFGIKAAGVAGIEYSLAPGLVLGFQFQPLAYRYDVIQICPKGFDKYNASHHNIKIFDMPVLKLGIRF